MPSKKVNNTQIELFEDNVSKTVAAGISVGDCFLHNDCLYMRVKPVNFINNSNLILDQLAKGRIFTANITKGTFYVLDGDTVVVPVETRIRIRKI